MLEPSYYAVIPSNVRYDEKLSANAKLLYGEITSLANKKGYCFANNAYFAELYNMSERQVIRLINNLYDLNYIDIISRKNQQRKIYICDAIAMTKMSLRYDKNVSAGGDKNVTHNNTSINNKDNIYTDVFENWYKQYPKKFNKQQTFKNWNSVLKSFTVDELYKSLENYKSYLETNKVSEQFITRSTNFLGKKAEYEAWLEVETDTIVSQSENENTAFTQRMERFKDAY